MRQYDGSRIVLLSGPICSGKSELAEGLRERHGARVLRTRDLIRAAVPHVAEERAVLQRAGTRLDREDGGIWIKTALARLIEGLRAEGPLPELLVIDAVRIEAQIAAIRSALGTLVHHIHLTASEESLAARYEERGAASDGGVPFEKARRQVTERGVGKLASLADIVVETDRCSRDAVLTRATALLGLYPRSATPLVDLLIGGQYGSEGKGNIVGHIAPEYDLLVRVGGPTRATWFSATPFRSTIICHRARSAPNARLLLGAGAVLRVPKLLQEIGNHGIDADRLSIDPQAMIIEDADIQAEEALAKEISSTQQGVGSASANKIMGRGWNSAGSACAGTPTLPERCSAGARSRLCSGKPHLVGGDARYYALITSRAIPLRDFAGHYGHRMPRRCRDLSDASAARHNGMSHLSDPGRRPLREIGGRDHIRGSLRTIGHPDRRASNNRDYYDDKKAATDCRIRLGPAPQICPTQWTDGPGAYLLLLRHRKS